MEIITSIAAKPHALYFISYSILAIVTVKICRRLLSIRRLQRLSIKWLALQKTRDRLVELETLEVARGSLFDISAVIAAHVLLLQASAVQFFG
jgi:hypothetical protein